MFNHQLGTCKTDQGKNIKEEDLKNCEDFINARREARHYKTMDRQKQKLEQLCQRNSSKRDGCSNQHGDHTCINTDNSGISPANITNTNKWVINISSKPLTQATGEAVGPWAKLCCGPEKPTHYRICSCNRNKHAASYNKER